MKLQTITKRHVPIRNSQEKRYVYSLNIPPHIAERVPEGTTFEFTYNETGFKFTPVVSEKIIVHTQVEINFKPCT